MQKQKRLLLARNIFVFVIVICFGIIIVHEKSAEIFLPKAEKKLNDYFEKNFSDIEDDVSKKKVTFNNLSYKMQVVSKENKNLFFYIYYSNKKVTDTYKKDFVYGKSLLNKINGDLEKAIRKTTSTSVEIQTDNLDKYTSIVRDKIIKEDNLLNLKFYDVKKELIINDWNSKNISVEINNLINTLYKENITPREYIIVITNKKNITESIEISSLDEKFITDKNKEKIINYILEDKKEELNKISKIKYEYLN